MHDEKGRPGTLARGRRWAWIGSTRQEMEEASAAVTSTCIVVVDTESAKQTQPHRIASLVLPRHEIVFTIYAGLREQIHGAQRVIVDVDLTGLLCYIRERLEACETGLFSDFDPGTYRRT